MDYDMLMTTPVVEKNTYFPSILPPPVYKCERRFYIKLITLSAAQTLCRTPIDPSVTKADMKVIYRRAMQAGYGREQAMRLSITTRMPCKLS